MAPRPRLRPLLRDDAPPRPGTVGRQRSSVGTPLKVTYRRVLPGRHNRIYERRASLVGSCRTELVEMPRNHDRATRRGRHARLAPEETRGTRIADARIVEAKCPRRGRRRDGPAPSPQMLGSASLLSADSFPLRRPTEALRALTTDTREAPGGARRRRHAVSESVKRGQ